jgi:uncharacterized damage-inducible protein DinB
MIGGLPRFTTRWWQSEGTTEGVSLETTHGSAQTVGDEFVDASRVFLRQDFLPKLLHCLNSMTDDQIWWRPNEQSNSVGNLVLHLCGNLKQWIVVSLGGQKGHRDRDGEFATRAKISRAELISAMNTAVAEAESVLLNFPTDQLLVQYPVQVYQVSALRAVYHVVEHFSYHLGQILYIYKLRTGQDPGFYRQLDKK